MLASKKFHYLSVILALTGFVPMIALAQSEGTSVHSPQDCVSINIAVSRPNLADAIKEANKVKVAFPRALHDIYHKDVPVNYAPFKVLTKKVGSLNLYQVTVVGTGKP